MGFHAVGILGNPIKAGLLVAKGAVSATLLILVVRSIDVSQAFQQALSAHPGWFAAGLTLLAFQPFIGAWRWHLIMRRLGARTRLGFSLGVTYVGTFLNQVIPGGFGGDAIRVWLSYRSGALFLHAFGGTALDRMLSFACLAVLGSLSAVALIEMAGAGALVASLLAVGPVAIIAVTFVIVADRYASGLLQTRWLQPISGLCESARRVVLSPLHGSAAIGLAFLGNLNLIASLFMFSRAFSIELDYWLLAITLAPVILASALPISIGGWGTREFAMVTLLSNLEVVPGQALMASASFGAVSLVVALPGAVILATRVQRPGPRHAAPDS